MSQISRHDLVPTHTAAFISPWWDGAFRPGGKREVSMGYCIGQKQLGFTLRRPCYHVGIADPGQAWPCIQGMKRRRYGAGCYIDGRYAEDDRSWLEWFLARMSDGIQPSVNSPVSVTERGILVRLPETLDPSRFDDLMIGAIREGSLARWLRTTEGVGHCAMLDVDPAIGRRFTSPSVGTSVDPEPVDGIVMCAQGTAQGRMIHVAESAILAHLRAGWPEAA